MRRGATTAGALGLLAAGGHRIAPQASPVGRAEAVAPIVAAGAIAAGGGAVIATDAYMREHGPASADQTSDGLTPAAMKQQHYQIAKTRKSNDESTFVDNLNLVDGVEHVTYSEGKIAAIQEINDQESQDVVEGAAIDAVDEYETTVIGNFLKSWNETALELKNMADATEEHPDVSIDSEEHLDFDRIDDLLGYDLFDYEYEFPNGETMDVHHFVIEGEYYSGDPGVRTRGFGPIYAQHSSNITDQEFVESWDEYTDRGGNDRPGETSLRVKVMNGEGDTVEYCQPDKYYNVLEELESLFDDVRDGLLLWVDEVYGDVQAGDLDTDDLFTPRELAEISSEDEGVNQAIADLQALNVGVDLEREATVEIPSVGATLRGTLGYTGDDSVSTGTIDPDAEDESYYLTYDVTEGEGEWEAVEDGIDGGTMTFTEEPYPETVYEVHTGAGETAEVTEDDFTPVDDDGEEVDEWDAEAWEVDLSDQLEDSITEVNEVLFFADTDEDGPIYETIALQDTFEVKTFEDTGGEQYDEADFSRSEPQDDDNYITEEEWDDLQEQNEELIDAYEDSQGDGIDIGVPSFGGWDELEDSPLGLGILAIAALAVIGVVTDLLPGFGD